MKENHIDMKEVYDELLLECENETIREMDQKAETEEMARQQKDQVTSPLISPEKFDKKLLWRKFLDRIGNPDRNYTTMIPHVTYKKITMVEIIGHYKLLEMVAGRGVEFDSNVLNLQRDYSEFRPVHGDGECFYMSFIFSYLEQVLDRKDKHEEHRLLAAVEAVSRQHRCLGWASEFSRSHKAFKKLIKKVMSWKTHRRWKHVPTTNSFFSYRREKLLDFFSSYVRTNESFAFLRLAAAIWICSHSEECEPLLPEFNEGYTLTDWCFQEVIERKVFTHYVQIIALVTALGVPLRVEYLFQESGQDLYTGQESQDDMSRSMCWPRNHHLLPPDHEVPRVTLLYTKLHYDIIYPHRSDGPQTSIDESSSKQSDKVESWTAKSPSQHQGGSCSENSDQQVALKEDSTAENSNQLTVHGASQSEMQQFPVPQDLLWSILLLLPAVDINRNIGLCKQFRNITSEEKFRISHSKKWSPRVIILFKPDINDDDLDQEQLSIDLEGFNITNREVLPVVHLTCEHLPFDDMTSVQIQGTCNGVLLLSFDEDLCICNPWTGWWGHLDPYHIDNVIVGLYSSTESDKEEIDYHVLCRTDGLQNVNSNSYWIVTLNTAGVSAPRMIGCPVVPGSPEQLYRSLQVLPPAYEVTPMVVKDDLIWHLPPYFGINHLIKFDIRREMFGVVYLPDTEDLIPYQVLQAQDKIAMSFLSQGMDKLDVMLLLDETENIWAPIHHICLLVALIEGDGGYIRFPEPVLYVVSPTLDILIWCPSFLIVVDSTGVVQGYHEHLQGWLMAVPHILKVSLEDQELLSIRENTTSPPLF